MSAAGAWPGEARGALTLSFDNLGEAAEIELGAIAPEQAPGDHFTATRVLPRLLALLGERKLDATFFVEGLNCELYPDRLAEIAAAGHEVGYHAWRHERWAELSAERQRQNLARGLAAFAELGIEPVGLRPPGGGLGPGGTGVLREAGLRYASPAGSGAGERDGLALLPFSWRHVDATCLLPPLGPVRAEISGSGEPIEPAAFLAHLEAEIAALTEEGGFLAVVLHLSLIDWLGWEALGTLLDAVGRAEEEGYLWVAPCAAVAECVLTDPDRFRDGTALDATSWAGAG